MKIYIKKNTLLEALQLIISISPKASSELIIHNVLLETESQIGSQSLYVKATNYENTLSGRFEVKIEEPGRICVNANKLFNLIREFRGEIITLQSTPQNWVYITSMSSKVKLAGVEPEYFPLIEFKDQAKRLKIPGQWLKTAIDRTYFAIGDNVSRKSLMGLNMEIVSERLIVWTGADAFRISQNRTVLQDPIDFSGNIVIPKRSLVEIKKIIDFCGGEVMISFDESTFQVITDQIKFKTSLIEAEFPNLKGLLEKEGIYRLRIPRQELINAVKILHTVTSSELNSVMKMTIGKDRVLLESQKLEFGEGNDEIACEYDGEEISLGVSIRFFLELLQVFENSDDSFLNITLTDAQAPLTIGCDVWSELKTILMPVRIQW